MKDKISLHALLLQSWFDLKHNIIALAFFSFILYILIAITWLGNRLVPWYIVALCSIIKFIILSCLSKNYLDIVFQRPLSWMTLSLSIIKSSLLAFCISNFVDYEIILKTFVILEKLTLILLNFDLEFYSKLVIGAIFIILCLVISIICFFSIRFMFVYNFILEKNSTVIQAYAYSYQITKRFFLAYGSFLAMTILYFIPILFFLHIYTDIRSMLYIKITIEFFMVLYVFIVSNLFYLMHTHLFKKLLIIHEKTLYSGS